MGDNPNPQPLPLNMRGNRSQTLRAPEDEMGGGGTDRKGEVGEVVLERVLLAQLLLYY